MSEHIVDRLKGIIAGKLDVNLKKEDIDENVSLFEDGLGLDSIAIVELIVNIEKEFDISIQDDELNAGLFRSLNVLGEFIGEKTGLELVR
jgi:acyl carrier protein